MVPCRCIALLALIIFSFQDFVQGTWYTNFLRGLNTTYSSGIVGSPSGCEEIAIGKDANSGNPSIPELSWLLTPSIVKEGPGRYRVLSRAVHLEYLKEQLLGEGLKFDAERKEMALVDHLEILTDTLYIKGKVSLHGIKSIKMYTREIVTSPGSQLDVSAPNWNQEFKTSVKPGSNGEDGKDGIDGPQVEIFTDVFRGTLDVKVYGGDGHKGQDGGDGENGASAKASPDKPSTVCTDQRGTQCNSFPGQAGAKGSNGKPGGNAGKPGNGGKSGKVLFRYGKLLGKIQWKNCRGKGAPAASNGKGGSGGAGGRGGNGRNCRSERTSVSIECSDGGETDKARDGASGDPGAPGTTPDTPGKNGIYIKRAIENKSRKNSKEDKYPLELLYLMKRKAEDVLLGDGNDASGRAALGFILKIATGSDTEAIKKDARLKLAFLGKPGYDMFGKNKLFAPRLMWQALADGAEEIAQDALRYEEAFNGIMSDIRSNKKFAELGQKMSEVARLQVAGEQKRLVEAKDGNESEKRLNVKLIQCYEVEMENILIRITKLLSALYNKAVFNADDFLALLQSLVGFYKSIANKDPCEFIDTALTLAGGLKGKECLKSLKTYLSKTKKWLTFGKHYTPLKDSSDLDFDKLDVSSVPEIMQVNLEINKENLAAELFCLLDVASRPQDTAEFKSVVESFFIIGTSRIALIGKVLDLDNELGGNIFDIAVLKETQKSIAEVGKPIDSPIRRRLQLNFMENLLSTYRQLERSFMKNVYQLHKAFRFRTLWDGENPLAMFRRVATENVYGTGQLSGVLQLTKVMTKVKDVEKEAVRCFTNNAYTTSIQKWTFDNNTDSAIFEELTTTGATKFTINIDSSCDVCFNIRLLKMYIELTGEKAQPDSVPAKVNLQVRHHSASFFRAGDNEVKRFHQALSSFREMKFNRFQISDQLKCKSELKKGNERSKFCVEEDDSRLMPMCSQSLRSSSPTDTLLGKEECKSPFGIYELKIPVDKTLPCEATRITVKNCKDLDLTKFTKMNVWGSFYFWANKYPTGPKDSVCKVASLRKQDRKVAPANYSNK